MSSLIVEVTEIQKISPHPNADLLEIVIVKLQNPISGSIKRQQSQLIIPLFIILAKSKRSIGKILSTIALFSRDFSIL